MPLCRPALLRTVARATAVATVGAAVLAATAGCRHQAPPAPPPGALAPGDRPESEAWGARLRTTTDGQPALEIDAPYLARFAGTDTSYVFLGPPPARAATDTAAARVTVRLYGADGAAPARVEADRAWFYEGERRLVAEGRVVATVAEAQVAAPRLTTSGGDAFVASGGAVVDLRGRANARVRARTVSGRRGRYEATGGAVVETSGGRRLEAARVVWSEAAGRFSAPGAFSFDGPGERVRGVDLSATADLSRYTFRRAAGQIEVRE